MATEQTRRGPMAGSEDYATPLAQVLRALAAGDRDAARRVLEPMAFAPPPHRGGGGLSTTLKAEIFERDRYQCRYCGRRVVLTEAMRLVSLVFPDLFPYHLHWAADQSHEAYMLAAPNVDHVVPLAAGGAARGASNLATACAVCNITKGNMPLDMLGWPMREPADPNWHGLGDWYWPAWEALGRPEVSKGERSWLDTVRRLYGTTPPA